MSIGSPASDFNDVELAPDGARKEAGFPALGCCGCEVLCDGRLGVLMLEVIEDSCRFPFVPFVACSGGADAEESLSSCFTTALKIPNTIIYWTALFQYPNEIKQLFRKIEITITRFTLLNVHKAIT